MSTYSRPKTMKEAVDQLWDDVRGTNGNGLVALAKKNREDIGEIMTDMNTLKSDVGVVKGLMQGHLDALRPSTDKPTRKQIAIKHLAETAIAALVIGGLVLAALLMIGGRLTADDIVNILQAWKGAP